MSHARLPTLVLASSSEARLGVLVRSGLRPNVEVSGVDEAIDASLTASQAAEMLAVRKATAVSARCAGSLVIGCDSLLELNGTPIGKPETAEEAGRIWHELNGSESQLHTGHCIIDTSTQQLEQAVGTTKIRFSSLSREALNAYIASGEPLGKAGGFALEGKGGWFIESIEGDPSNIVGISLPLVSALMSRLGYSVCDYWELD